MSRAAEIAEHVTTATGLCLNISDFAPGWVILKTIVFFISAGISAFDTYTDWRMVMIFRKVGFNNPLIPPSVHWLRAWYLFAVIGTVLTIVTILHDVIVLLYSVYMSFKKQCSKHVMSHSSRHLEYGGSGRGQTQEDSESDDGGEISDPCRPCYHFGCNVASRSETLSALSLFFQDIPMVTIAVLYALSQTKCKTPEYRDISPIYRDVIISIVASMISGIWSIVRSSVHLYSSFNVWLQLKVDKKYKRRKCLPKKGDVVCPPGTWTQKCVFGLVLSLSVQITGVISALVMISTLASFYARFDPNIDNSLGIYRIKGNIQTYDDVRLLNLSDTIFRPNSSSANETFLHLEQIPRGNPNGRDVFCLSEFEYRREASQIFFNTIEIIVVSDDGSFCTTHPQAGSTNYSRCSRFYRVENLYYGFLSSITDGIAKFYVSCMSYAPTHAFAPVRDFSIDVARHVNRTDFPSKNDSTMVVILPPNDYHRLNFTEPFSTLYRVFQDSDTNSTFGCLTSFLIHDYSGRVLYNFRDVDLQGSVCNCSPSDSPARNGTKCVQYHQNLMYGYLTEDGDAIPYTHCSGISPEKLVPYYQPSLPI